MVFNEDKYTSQAEGVGLLYHVYMTVRQVLSLTKAPGEANLMPPGYLRTPVVGNHYLNEVD